MKQKNLQLTQTEWSMLLWLYECAYKLNGFLGTSGDGFKKCLDKKDKAVLTKWEKSKFIKLHKIPYWKVLKQKPEKEKMLSLWVELSKEAINLVSRHVKSRAVNNIKQVLKEANAHASRIATR